MHSRRKSTLSKFYASCSFLIYDILEMTGYTVLARNMHEAMEFSNHQQDTGAENLDLASES